MNIAVQGCKKEKASLTGENRQKNFLSGTGVLRPVPRINRTESTGTKGSAERDIRLSALLLPGR